MYLPKCYSFQSLHSDRFRLKPTTVIGRFINNFIYSKTSILSPSNHCVSESLVPAISKSLAPLKLPARQDVIETLLFQRSTVMKLWASCQRRPVRQQRRQRRRLFWRQLLLSVCLLVCRVSDSFFSLAGQLNCLTSRRPRSHTRLAPHKHSCRGQWTVIGSACAPGSPTSSPSRLQTLSGALERVRQEDEVPRWPWLVDGQSWWCCVWCLLLMLSVWQQELCFIVCFFWWF